MFSGLNTGINLLLSKLMPGTFFLNPIIVTGPSGCGKSFFIKKKAEEEGKILLHCPCRKDRTLREGRQILHTWAKRSENSVIWLEGADDLTPESQAFLRRISEMHSPNVSFILECRDGSKLQEPIRSRYSIWSISRPSWNDFETAFPELVQFPEIRQYIDPTEYSFRKILNCLDLAKNHDKDWKRCLEVKNIETEIDIINCKFSLKDLQRKAINPNKVIQSILMKNPQLLNDYGKFIFNNGNPWAFLGYVISLYQK